ncbi:hypothetical protein [Deinococcus cellulosilyticus]|uniref:Uncharacterized protein n=1 Tax=Deinococcus cellulosilyticus (strain DSM 18568 / NBRC 106333 / KACC 11606 / 5516J-15) TaxID=1223518 RepID=A0A511N781_DEIC1|nr:hypothetical protein [Deinococcus cellulosilyticus]GEM48709.1 hypothetical protein DC3_43440 [Deinococcus cellulosilyticus NBRC 106333 = KACC 11606]
MLQDFSNWITGMDWGNWLSINMKNGKFSIIVGPGMVTLALILGLLWAFFAKPWRRARHWGIEKAEISLVGHKIEIRPNHDVVRVAYKAWIELSTRKAGIEFDEDNDVIVEVYNSWFELFRELRSIAREFPAEKLREDPESRKIVKLITESLNEGLRPHLTQWQAKFRRWYNQAVEAEENKGLEPQQIQKKFGEYEDLKNDLIQKNKEIKEYAEFLRKLSHGESVSIP